MKFTARCLKYSFFTDIKQGGKMKKFFIGLLSVFLLIGAGILSACGSNKVTLSLSSDYVSIRLYSGAEEGDIAPAH